MEFKTGFKSTYLIHPFKKSRPPWASARFYGSGRAAIVDIIRYWQRIYNIQWVLIPCYICDELPKALAKISNLKIVPYKIDLELNPEEDDIQKSITSEKGAGALILVDFFASTDTHNLAVVAQKFKLPTIFDCVHSFPSSSILLDDFQPNWIVVAGFRKLFWRIVGSIALGPGVIDLPALPKLISEASPNFPRNLTLTPRFGTFGTWFLKNMINWQALENCSRRWPVGIGRRGFLSALNSPVSLMPITNIKNTDQVLGAWPDLPQYEDFAYNDRARRIKETFIVSRKPAISTCET